MGLFLPLFVRIAPFCAKAPLGGDDETTTRVFSWHLFANYTRLLKRAVSDLGLEYHVSELRSSGGVFVTDVDSMTALRGDGHRPQVGDCLHYYLPGPVDSWNHLLVAVLLQHLAGEVERSIGNLAVQLRAIESYYAY